MNNYLRDAHLGYEATRGRQSQLALSGEEHREAGAGILGRITVIVLLSCAIAIYWFIR